MNEFSLAQAALTFTLDALDTPARPLDHEQAAAFPAVAMTAYDLLANAARIRSGGHVLIHTASGGVGIAAGQIARALGAGLVLGTTSSQQKADYAYDQVFLVAEYEQAVMDATGGKGIDIALDARGEPTRSQNLALPAPLGRLVVHGNASNAPEQSVLPSVLWRSNKVAIGCSITALSRTTPHLIAASVQQALRLTADGLLRRDIPEVLPFTSRPRLTTVWRLALILGSSCRASGGTYAVASPCELLSSIKIASAASSGVPSLPTAMATPGLAGCLAHPASSWCWQSKQRRVPPQRGCAVGGSWRPFRAMWGGMWLLLGHRKRSSFRLFKRRETTSSEWSRRQDVAEEARQAIPDAGTGCH